MLAQLQIERNAWNRVHLEKVVNMYVEDDKRGLVSCLNFFSPLSPSTTKSGSI